MEDRMLSTEIQSDLFHIGVKSEKIYSNSYNIKYITYDQNSHLIINHGEELIIFNSKKNQISRTVSQPHSSPYINLTFSNKFKCFFLLDANQYIKVYSLDSLIPLATGIDIKGIRHCIDFLYLDQYGAFLVLFPDCLKLLFVQINSNHLRSLFSNAYKFSIKEIESKILSPHYFLQFASKIVRVNQYFVLNNCDSVKIIWHAADRNFHQKQTNKQQQIRDISKGILDIFSNRISTPSNYSRNTIVSVKRICENPEQISYVYFDPQSWLLLCGSSQGELMVYKINMRNIIATASPMKFGKNNKSNQIQISAKNHQIFKLKLHNSKPIISIQMYSPKLILTVGADQYIQVISYDQMASIERFRSSAHLADINFITNSIFLASKTIDFDQYLYRFQISLDYQLKIYHNSQIMHALFNKETSMLILSDNSLNILQLTNLKQKKQHEKKKNILPQKRQIKNKFNTPDEVNKEQIELQTPIMIPKQSFVPPRCKSILSVESYPFQKNNMKNLKKQQYWILTDQSQIYRYVYIYEQDRFQIIQVHELNHFTDSYNHETKQKVITMKFIDVVPVHFDSDIKQKKYYPNLKKVEEIRPIAFGCETGQVLICSSLILHQIISRIRIFAEPVKTICSCFYPQSSESIEELVSGGENQFKNDSMLMIQKQKQQIPHRRRLLIFNSHNEIVAAMISNYMTPQIIYKLFLNKTSLPLIKNLGNEFVGVATGFSTKVLFPSRKDASKLKIWVHSSQIHEAQITCFEYCGGIKCISGDQIGKVVFWTLLSEVLAVVYLSDRIPIELCYCWDGSILFGHSGKIFQMNKKIKYQQQKTKIGNQAQQLADYQILINQSTIDVTLYKSNQSIVSQLFKFNNQFVSSEQSEENTNINSLEIHNILPESRSKQIQKYVKKMKKSLIKLAHQNQSHNSQTHIIKSSRHQQNKSNFKIGKSKSVTKQLTTLSDKIDLGDNILANSKVGRAKSILNKFRQIQEKDFKNQTIEFKQASSAHDISLPQIKNIPIIKVQEHRDESIKKKKNRNKKYEFLFHFPNSGLYSQLISKNMIQ